MFCCVSTELVGRLALLYVGYYIARIVYHYLRSMYERYTAPVIAVKPPSVSLTGGAAATQLTPMSAGAGKIQCYDKGSNTPVGIVEAIPPATLKAMVDRAREAQKQWAKTPFSVRRQLLFSLLRYVIEHQRGICATTTVECGKTMVDASLGEILTTCEKLRWTIARGEDVLAEEVRDVGLITIHKRASVVYEPFGVIGAIVSWNYPFHNVFGPMISALFAGNAFVCKVSEYTSYYTKYYESIVREGLKALGQSPELVHFVTGFAETGEALIGAVDKITFIGSPGVGKKVMLKAAETLTPVVLELGGKDPAIVCEDADLSQVVPILLRGTFQNCGQNCVGLERIVIHSSIHDRVMKELTDRVQKLSQGCTKAGDSAAPVYDCGAMTMGPNQVKKIKKLVDDTVAAGAKLVTGGNPKPDSTFFPPTILTNVTSAMPIAQEEVFGPIMVVMKFSTDAEAVNIVNNCPYGLGSNVFTGDVARGQRIGSQLKTGMFNINDFAINYLCQSLPFGGTKVSGFDRFAGEEGLKGNCLVKSITRDRIPGVKTLIPPVLQYPIKANAFGFLELLVRLMWGTALQAVMACVGLATFKA